MPHLDANALSTDPSGMEFLADVLDVSPAADRACWGAFDPKLRASTVPNGFDNEPNGQRCSELVSEPA